MAKRKNNPVGKNTPKCGTKPEGDFPQKWLLESLGILLMAITLFLIVILIPIDRPLTIRGGLLGKQIANALFSSTGYIAYLLPIILGTIGFFTFRHRTIQRKISRVAGIATLVPLLSTFIHLIASSLGGEQLAGGHLGALIGNLSRTYLGLWGSLIISLALILVAILIVTDISYYLVTKRVRRKTGTVMRQMANHIENMRDRRAARKELAAASPAPERSPRKPSDTAVKDYPLDSHQPMLPIISIPEKQLASKNGESPTTAKRNDKLAIIETVPAEYELPSLDLLDDYPAESDGESEEELLSRSELLVKKLADFNIEGIVTEVCPGPVITRYEFQPAPGIKISKITGLANDIALGLKSRHGLRVAPVPGKSTLGVEIPNSSREIVSLKDILESSEFRDHAQKSLLTLPLGKDIAGRPYVSDLNRMPHLLIAGATGAGKSVCINSLLCGLLFTAKPEELRLLLIDPKMLELSDFNGIPHLREPVITDVRQAPAALQWAVDEMNQRYQKLADLGVRNIDQYNKKVKSPAYDGEEEPLPYIVIVIDELADLMLTTPSDVEEAIQRLAQMARAAGIHLIIATQRPSVDVITGVIKANLPCRLAFQVASKIDSRTILDTMGAEKLLGMGDSLFIPPGTSQQIRIHGAFVSESEIKRVVKHLQVMPGVQGEESIFKMLEDRASEELGDVDDPLYDEAVKLVLTSGLASISMIQRRLKVGHSRASRLMDYMEINGIVGPFEGSKPREILVERDEFLNRLSQIEEDGVYDE